MLEWLAQSKDLSFDLSNIEKYNGIGIAATGMFVVFVALSLISGAIAALPKMLEIAEEVFPFLKAPPEKLQAAVAETDDAALVAAIGLALIRATEPEQSS